VGVIRRSLELSYRSPDRQASTKFPDAIALQESAQLLINLHTMGLGVGLDYDVGASSPSIAYIDYV